MLYVACPSCGERGKIPSTLIGSRIKCKKCGNSFQVAAPPAKAATPVEAVATAATPVHEGIAVEGLDSTAWSLTNDHPELSHADSGPVGTGEHSSGFVAQEPTGFKEYKLLTSKDKIFEGKFDLARLEEALNFYARQGWVAKAMSTPHVKGFSGGPQEEIVVLLER